VIILSAGRRIIREELFNDLEDAVSALHRVIHDEAESWGVFEHDRPPNQALDAFPVLREQRKSAFLLLGPAQNTDENDSRMEVAGNVHVIDRNQAHFANLEFPADGFTDLALQKLADALDS